MDGDSTNIYNLKHINRSNKKSFIERNSISSMWYNIMHICENDFIKKYKQK
jgi:hypothetical protein